MDRTRLARRVVSVAASVTLAAIIGGLLVARLAVLIVFSVVSAIALPTPELNMIPVLATRQTPPPGPRRRRMPARISGLRRLNTGLVMGELEVDVLHEYRKHPPDRRHLILYSDVISSTAATMTVRQ